MKPRKALMIRVLVHDIATDQCIREHTMDYNRSDKRRWLASICLWAFHNGKSVETLNIADDRKP
jgi:hypothetical protein